MSAPDLKQVRPGQEFVQVRQAARKLGVSHMTIYRWLADGKLTSIKIGKIRRIRLTDIEKLMGGGE